MGPDWIAIDHGEAGPRGWAMSGADPHGPAGAAPDRLRARWPGLPEIVSGHADAALAELPCKPLDFLPVPPGRPNLIPAIAAPDGGPPVRSAGTRIAGFLALNPGWDGVICLPGARSRWAQISAGEIVSIQSCLSGGLFEALAADPALHDLPEGDAGGFAGAVSDAMSQPERLAARLAAPGTLARLRGVLIGTELAAVRAYWLGQQLAVIGLPDAARLYADALEAQGAPVIRTDETRMMLAGLTAAWRRMKDRE